MKAMNKEEIKIEGEKFARDRFGKFTYNSRERDAEERAYIAGRTKSMEREKELEEGLRMLLDPENREHMISIASATLSGELAKQLLK